MKLEVNPVALSLCYTPPPPRRAAKSVKKVRVPHAPCVKREGVCIRELLIHPRAPGVVMEPRAAFDLEEGYLSMLCSVAAAVEAIWHSHLIHPPCVSARPQKQI